MAHRIIALLFIFFQSAYFSIVLIRVKAYVENTYVFVLIFIILSLFSFDLMTLTPALMASPFLLFALSAIFREVEFKIQRDETILLMGVYIGIASLFVMSYGYFLVISLFLLIVFARINFRKVILLFYGFGLPHFILIMVYFVLGEMSPLWNYYYEANFTLAHSAFISIKSLIVLGSIPLLFFLISLFMVNREARLTKYQSQVMQIMLLWVVFSFLHLMVVRDFSAQSVFPILPGLAYFITSYLLLIRRRRIAEVMTWIFVIGTITTSYLSRYQKISHVDYTAYFIPPSKYANQVLHKKIMILGEDWSLYNVNNPASGFINWKLAETIFKNPDYGNLVFVHTAMSDELPEIIVDETDLMSQFFNRIPELKAKYKREGELYRKINN